ncbi:hypothetical protein M9458_051375, partial [Cirrhinus mrigala]
FEHFGLERPMIVFTLNQLLSNHYRSTFMAIIASAPNRTKFLSGMHCFESEYLGCVIASFTLGVCMFLPK